MQPQPTPTMITIYAHPLTFTAPAETFADRGLHRFAPLYRLRAPTSAVGPLTAVPAAPVPNRATARAAARNIRLVPKDEITAAVEALDRKLEPDTCCSPLQVGTFERADCPYDGRYAAYVYHGIGNENTTFRFPALADDDEIEADARALFDKIRRKLDERRGV